MICLITDHVPNRSDQYPGEKKTIIKVAPVISNKSFITMVGVLTDHCATDNHQQLVRAVHRLQKKPLFITMVGILTDHAAKWK